MGTRRELLSGLLGACAGVVCWTVGSEVTSELQTSEVRYVLLRNATESRQTVTVLFESDGDPVFWETYELEPGQAVEVGGFERVGDYRVLVRWNDQTPTERLEAGTRAVAVVLAVPFGDEDVLIRDVPFSSLSPSQRSVGRTDEESTARAAPEPGST